MPIINEEGEAQRRKWFPKTMRTDKAQRLNSLQILTESLVLTENYSTFEITNSNILLSYCKSLFLQLFHVFIYPQSMGDCIRQQLMAQSLEPDSLGVNPISITYNIHNFVQADEYLGLSIPSSTYRWKKNSI